MDTQTERFNKQIQALQVTLDTEREKLMWTDQKLKEMSSKLSLSERNHLNSAKQTQDMQVYATRMCPPYVRKNVFFMGSQCVYRLNYSYAEVNIPE